MYVVAPGQLFKRYIVKPNVAAIIRANQVYFYHDGVRGSLRAHHQLLPISCSRRKATGGSAADESALCVEPGQRDAGRPGGVRATNPGGRRVIAARPRLA